jgi:hypothetical protein
MSQEIGYVTLSHGMSLVITLTKDWSSPVSRAGMPISQLSGMFVHGV